MKILKESDKAIVKSIEQKIKKKVVMEVAFKGQEEKTLNHKDTTQASNHEEH